MAELVLPNSIDAGTEIVAAEHQQNYEAIRAILNGQIEGGSGSDGNIAADTLTARELSNSLLTYGLPTGGIFQEGVVDSGDLDITAGAGLVLNYASGVAWVEDDSGVIATGALIPVTVTGSTVTVGANSSGNPRIDQIILTLSGYGTGTVSVLQGTATVGATLDNRTGAASLPNDAIRLADILVTNGFAGPFVEGTSIRDRRPWAKGALSQRLRTSGSGSSTSTTYTSIFASDIQQRAEISSGLAWVFIRSGYTTAAASYSQFFQLNIDGSQAGEEFMTSQSGAAALNYDPMWAQLVSLTPGSHLITLGFRNNAAQSTSFTGTAAHPTGITIVEIPARSSAANYNGTA